MAQVIVDPDDRNVGSAVRSRPKIGPTGFSTVFDPSDADVDIVFVHGIQGHPEKTWTYSPPTPKASLFSRSPPSPEEPVFWPYDLLLKSPCLSKARILTYGYKSDVVGHFTANNQQSISKIGRDLMVDLQQWRKNNPIRPVIFVAHSLGGILVKSALDQSKDSRHQRKFMSVYESTRGIIFLGTPHRGSPAASYGLLASNLGRVALQSPSKQVLRALDEGSEILENLHNTFLGILEDGHFHIHSFYETCGMTFVTGLSGLVVPFGSAQVGHAKHETTRGIDGNHHEICKFAHEDDAGYKAVLGALEDYIDEARRPLTTDWEGPRGFEVGQFCVDVVSNRLYSRQNPRAVQPQWFVPFPLNSEVPFLGREEELDSLRVLLTKADDDLNHRVVVVHGESGVGKTAMVAEYCRQTRKKYPNGIFWVTATNKYRISMELQALAAKLGLVSDSVAGEQQVLVAMKSFLENSSDWLLVFDGAGHMDHLSSIKGQLPWGSGGHVIISTARKSFKSKLDFGYEKDIELRKPASSLLEEIFLKTVQRNNSIGLKESDLLPAATFLSTKLGHLPPLAFTLVANALVSSGTEIKEYISSLENTCSKPSGECPEFLANVLKQLETVRVETFQLLCVLSFLDKIVERSYLHTAIDHIQELEVFKAEHRLGAALRHLEKLGLLKTLNTPELVIYQETLVQVWVRSYLSINGSLNYWGGWVFYVASAVYYPQLIPGRTENLAVTQVTMTYANRLQSDGHDPTDCSSLDAVPMTYGLYFNAAKNAFCDARNRIRNHFRSPISQ